MFSRSQTSQQLFNMMTLSESINQDFSICERMIVDHNIINRSYAIEWMKKVLIGESRDFVDMSIQIFDRYITVECAKDMKCLSDTRFLCHTAACSILLSLKMLDAGSRNRFNMSRFHSFDTQVLLEYEVKILNAIHYSIFPLCTPRSFVSMIVNCCPPATDIKSLVKTVDVMMNEIDERSELLVFAPSTIAISVLIMAFSEKDFNCSQWLDSLPDYCLPRNNPLYQAYPDALNVEKCVNFLVTLPPVLRIGNTPSPSGVADIH